MNQSLGEPVSRPNFQSVSIQTETTMDTTLAPLTQDDHLNTEDSLRNLPYSGDIGDNHCGSNDYNHLEFKHKILILSDQKGYNLNHLLNGLLKDSYCIQSILKPYAMFLNVIESIIELTKEFTLHDYVIITAGFNDFNDLNKNKFPPLFGEIKNLLKQLGHTNVVVLSVPYNMNSNTSSVNKLICKFNTKMYNFLNKLNLYVPGNFSFLDINSHSTPLKKNVICKLLSQLIYQKPISKNLIFINFVNDYSDMDSSHSKNIQSTGGGVEIESENVAGRGLGAGVMALDADIRETDPGLDLNLNFPSVDQPLQST